MKFNILRKKNFKKKKREKRRIQSINKEWKFLAFNYFIMK